MQFKGFKDAKLNIKSLKKVLVQFLLLQCLIYSAIFKDIIPSSRCDEGSQDVIQS